MTKILRFLTLTLIFVLLFNQNQARCSIMSDGEGAGTAPLHTVGGQAVVEARQVMFSPPAPTCDTFTVDNESSHILGEVVVSDGFTDYADFDVTGSGLFDQNICFTPNTVTVNGVAISSPGSGNVRLPGGSWVNVAWQSSSLVEVINGTGADSERR